MGRRTILKPCVVAILLADLTVGRHTERSGNAAGIEDKVMRGDNVSKFAVDSNALDALVSTASKLSKVSFLATTRGHTSAIEITRVRGNANTAIKKFDIWYVELFDEGWCMSGADEFKETTKDEPSCKTACSNDDDCLMWAHLKSGGENKCKRYKACTGGIGITGNSESEGNMWKTYYEGKAGACPKGKTLLSGEQDGLSSCKKMCKDRNDCQWFAFCPKDVPGCEGEHSNRCIAYSSCGDNKGRSATPPYSGYETFYYAMKVGGSGDAAGNAATAKSLSQRKVLDLRVVLIAISGLLLLSYQRQASV